MKENKLERLEIRLTENEKKRWRKFADADDSTMSEWTRHVINFALDQFSENLFKTSLKFQSTTDPENLKKSDVVKIYLKPSEALALKKVIESKQWTKQQLMIKLLRSYLTGNPILDKTEINTLANSNYQLRSVGTNLNQIAHAINANVEHLDSSLVSESLKIIKETRKTINDQVRTTSDFLRLCNARNKIQLSD